MTKLGLSQKLLLIGLIIFGIALSCQKKEQPNQPQQLIFQDDVVIDLSKETLQASLPDSQKVDFDTPPMPVGGFEVLKDYLIFPEFGTTLGSIFNVKIDMIGFYYKSLLDFFAQ